MIIFEVPDDDRVPCMIDDVSLLEQAFLRAVCTPSRANLYQAVLADPPVPESCANDLVRTLEIEPNTLSEVQDA